MAHVLDGILEVLRLLVLHVSIRLNPCPYEEVYRSI
jgi:hypothetical protein